VEQAQIDTTLNQIRNALEGNRIEDAIDALNRLRSPDLAEAFSDLDDKSQNALLPKLDIDRAADILEELEDDEAADFAETLPTGLLADVLDAMEPDEAADILGDLPPERAASAIAEMEEASDVLPLLGYGDETAGGLMTTSIVTLHPGDSASQAINTLRAHVPGSDTPYYLYVTEQDQTLAGIVGLRDLIVADPDTLISEIMERDVLSVSTDTDQEDAARLMVRYDLAALPVVGKEGVLWGVITHDDTMDVLEDEATEDIYRLANVSDADLSIGSPVGYSVRRRLPWLYLSALTALFASWVISRFEATIAQLAILAAFQSVVAGLGGNTATQSLAIVVRGLALGEIDLRSAWRAVSKEAIIGVIDGVAVGAVVGIGVYLWTGNQGLSFVLGISLIANMIVATVAGTIVPMGLKVIGKDPALASSVIVTSITDSVGFAVFLGLAALVLIKVG
jgi:magnesium transporter